MPDFAHKVLVMTDIHITKEGRKIIGLDPMERLKAALNHALEAHPDAACLVITGDLTVDLRSERAGPGDGREYSVDVECSDDSGNTAPGSVIVTVPHDQGN